MAQFSDYNFEQMYELLESLHDKFNCEEFIEHDPISVPHRYTDNRDREIAGFMAATIAWGNRKAIVRSANRMMEYMDFAPYQFVTQAQQCDLERLSTYVHRTFNGQDFIDFVRALQSICLRHNTIGELFQSSYASTQSIAQTLSDVRREFFSVEHNEHCQKHFSSIDKGAACKRLNMYLRWFVRRDNRGVDFGSWTKIPMSALYLPLDVHSGNMGRSLGLLTRRQNDWKATAEITQTLRQFCAEDPVKYDFALFGAGINSK